MARWNTLFYLYMFGLVALCRQLQDNALAQWSARDGDIIVWIEQYRDLVQRNWFSARRDAFRDDVNFDILWIEIVHAVPFDMTAEIHWKTTRVPLYLWALMN